MKSLVDYLQEFQAVADEWFAKSSFVGAHYRFFQEFFKKEHLAKCEWPDIQKIGDHIHSFNSMAIAKKNALGNPNHPIEHYRKSFTYLAHGSGTVEERIKEFTGNPEYQLRYFGDSAVSEIVGYLFSDNYVLYNDRDKFALNLLAINPSFSKGDDYVARLQKFNYAISPVVKAYREIVGKRTSYPLNLEIDQFFSYLYETYHSEGDGNDSAIEPRIDGVNYWTIAPGEKAYLWDQWQREGIITIGWDNLGNLNHYKDKSDIRARLQGLYSQPTSSKKNNAAACFSFAKMMKRGDVVFAKKGTKVILGYGLIESDYVFDNKREEHKHVRKVKWLKTGNWPLPEDEQIAMKTLTCITPYERFVEKLKQMIGGVPPEIEPYDKKKAMKGLFLAEAQFDEMLDALKEKKNIVLQGAPGVGKTFVARRLAYALIGSNDPQRVEMIQFHQSYSYEDFVQGFRPTPNGHFDLKYGLFHQFCHHAQREESAQKPYVFIIDEINRGNLSKIFGELMMLIEPDKRGEEYAIPLAYSQDADEKFYIPENLHLIGMMNTADRSLAMVDYALRRRFRFITLRSEFDSKGFQEFLADAGAKPDLVKKIIDRMNALNEVIAADSKNLGPGYQIGHSYFCPRNGIKPDADWYRRVVEAEIVPLIQEYWFDNEQKVKEQRAALLE